MRPWHSLVHGAFLPNVYRSVLGLAVLHFGLAIIVISSLAYLGYGNPPPAPDWGILLADGKDYTSRHWWMVGLPAAVVVLTGLALNRVSRLIGERRT